MAERETQRKATPSRHAEDEQVEEVATGGEAAETGERLKAELDDLLDEIDDVLETNAEDFVKSYVQKGGE